MKTTGITAAAAVGSALLLGAALATAPAHADRTKGATIDHIPLSGDYEGYCTWGAQEQIHDHTGDYIKALTGNAENWAYQAQAAGWTVVGEAQPHSIAVFSSSLVGGVGQVRLGRRRQRQDITITEMNTGSGATVAHGYHTTGFQVFDTRNVQDVPGMSYILIP